MSRKALSYLLLLLIALQSVTAMADVHPINYSDTAPYSSDFIDGSSSGVLDSSTATDPTDQNMSTDCLFHCHHHVYLSGNLTHPNFLHKHSLHNDSQALIPEAPSSSLYRPPIA
ncbi:MAG: hypothetical protein ABNH16_06205 [Thalassolituus sp.]|jgi:hypothetical protein